MSNEKGGELWRMKVEEKQRRMKAENCGKMMSGEGGKEAENGGEGGKR